VEMRSSIAVHSLRACRPRSVMTTAFSARSADMSLHIALPPGERAQHERLARSRCDRTLPQLVVLSGTRSRLWSNRRLAYSDPHDAVDRLGHSVLHPYFVDGAHVVLFSW
jgi:hypothetical protein